MSINRFLLFLSAVLAVLVLVSACRAADALDLGSQDALVLRNGSVFTATGDQPIPNGVVVIEGRRISAVGSEREIGIPPGATVIDVEGRTIMPGLIEGRASDLLNRLELEKGQISNFSLVYYLKNALRAGVTTIRATGWDWEKQQHIAEYRAALEALGNTIPSMVISGTALTHGEGAAYTAYYPDQLVGVVSLEETREIAGRLIDLGVDQVQVVMTLTKDSSIDSPDLSDPALSLEQLEAIVDVAHSWGIRVLAQTIYDEDAEIVLATGVDEIISWPVQFESLSDELISTLVENSVPVVSGFSVVPPQPGDLRRFLDAGGTLVFGTFAPNAQPLESAYLELSRMIKGGMTPMEAIQAATVNAAEAVGVGDTAGTLEVGKQADIIVIDGDPLEDIRAVNEVVYVVKGGELVVSPEGE